MESIVEKVARRCEEIGTQPMAEEIQNAVVLSELFAGVKPEEYVLPLDALAGFCVATRQKAGDNEIFALFSRL